MARAVIALALVVLPLQPMYGMAEGASHVGETANGAHILAGRTSAASRDTESHRGPRLDPIGETANGASLHRGPRLDPIGETANGASLHRGPRLDPIGETANRPSLACGPRLDPIGDHAHVSETAHSGPVAPIATEHSHADHDHAGSPVQDNSGNDPMCDGNCMSCTVGAILASALFPVSLSGSVNNAATPAARIEIVLPTKTHPPQVPA